MEKSTALYFFSSRTRPKGGVEYYKGEIQNGVSGLPACIDIYRAWLSVRCFGRVEVRTWQERGRELDDRPPDIFLDLTTSVEYLESSEYVVLKVKPLETREKQSV